MRVIGPKKVFILIEGSSTGEETGEGREITWDETDEFCGMINSLKGKEGVSYDQTGVIADYRLYTEYPDITEKHRIKLKETTREFDVKYVDNILMKDKIWMVDLLERKE